MTESLLPLLEKAAPDARVITVSSGGMYTAPLTTDLQVWTYSELLLAALLCIIMILIEFHINLFSLAMPNLMGWSSMRETSVFRFDKIENRIVGWRS